MTGRDLKLTTPNDVLTARDTLEYWSQKHMAVARGDAVVVTNDGRRVAADTLVAYTTEGHAAAAGRDAGRRPSRHQPTLRRSTGRVRQAAEGGGVRQRLGPHADRHRDRRSRRLCAGHRHRPAGRQRAHHARTEPARRDRGGGEHEDRHLASAVRRRASGCRAWWCRTMPPTSNCGKSAPGAPPAPAPGVPPGGHEMSGSRAETIPDLGAARAAGRRRTGRTRRRQDLQEAPGGAERLGRRCTAARRSACSARTAPARPRPST